jgi:hypothetical protein
MIFRTKKKFATMSLFTLFVKKERRESVSLSTQIFIYINDLYSGLFTLKVADGTAGLAWKAIRAELISNKNAELKNYPLDSCQQNERQYVQYQIYYITYA